MIEVPRSVAEFLESDLYSVVYTSGSKQLWRSPLKWDVLFLEKDGEVGCEIYAPNGRVWAQLPQVSVEILDDVLP